MKKYKLKLFILLPIFLSLLIMFSCGTKYAKMENSDKATKNGGVAKSSPPPPASPLSANDPKETKTKGSSGSYKGKDRKRLLEKDAISYDEEAKVETTATGDVGKKGTRTEGSSFGQKHKKKRKSKTQNDFYRIIIYTASIKIEAENVLVSKKKIIQHVKKIKGYVQAMYNNRLVVRIPAQQLDAFLQKIGKYGRVVSKNLTSTDVTEEYFDLKLRLKNAKKMRKRLLKLLKKTQNVTEAVTIERELQRITEQIELFEGRLKYMKEMSSFSKVTIDIVPRPTGPVLTQNILDRARGPFEWVKQLGAEFLLDY